MSIPLPSAMGSQGARVSRNHIIEYQQTNNFRERERERDIYIHIFIDNSGCNLTV
jgi:hypothetical protein